MFGDRDRNAPALGSCTAGLVMAQAEQRMQQMASHFQEGGSTISTVGVVVFCVVVAALGLVGWCVARHMAAREGGGYYSPQRLFRDLCRWHELDAPSRRLLLQLARARGIAHPAQLFLARDCFQMDGLPARLLSSGPRLAELQRRLFGDVSPPAGEA